MRKWINLILSATIMSLIQSCASVSSSPNSSSQKLVSENLVEPDIKFNREEAFYPYRKTKDGKIVPTYQQTNCLKKFLGICTKKEMVMKEFHDLEWFWANDFGACKRPSPLK